MSNNMNALYLTHPITLKSEVTGGVQLCSQEFYHMLAACGFKIEPFYVSFTRKFTDRIFIRFKTHIYRQYDVKKEQGFLIETIRTKHIKWVFLNMAQTLRYAKPIKEAFGTSVKVVMLSHGNESGDFLHLTTKPLPGTNYIKRIINIVRLGFLIHIESLYRVKYLDAVLSVSETEQQIENWFGAVNSIFVPRLIKNEQLSLNPVRGRIGFVGRLDHPPNYQGITLLLDELSKLNHTNIELRLVGAPESWGKKISSKYSFVNYLGELSNEELKKEAASWSLFLNPVFWYSTGVTTKVAKAIGWGVPLLSTTAGLRGYKWKEGTLATVETPKQMAQQIVDLCSDHANFLSIFNEMRQIQKSAYNSDEIAALVTKQLNNLEAK